MKVKLLNVDLIRNFGGAVVSMTDSQARKYINDGKAIAYIEPTYDKRRIDKLMQRPEHNKMVWSPPEKKVFDSSNEDKKKGNSFPGPEDNLFPQI